MKDIELLVSMKVCIIGCGGIALSTAFDLVNTNNDVVIYTSKSEYADGFITEINENDETVGTVNGVGFTSDLKFAIENAKYIIITYPAFMLNSIAEKLDGIIDNSSIICVFPGTGGAEFAFNKLIMQGVTLAGLQRVPYIARVKDICKSVKMSGKKTELFLATVPKSRCSEVCDDFEKMFSIPCHSLPNYLSVTFTPSNPILHTTRLYSMFKDNSSDYEYDRNFLFYEEWDEKSAEILIACDKELQDICNTIDGLDLTNVVSLCDYYESHTPVEMKNKLSSIVAFKGIGFPMKQNEKGKWVVDWKSRYFTADFPYGLAIIKAFADILNVNTPNIDRVIEWYKGVGKEKLFDLNEYSVDGLNDIINLYNY